MIVHEYGEWREPEKPPFTVEDVVRAIQEMMMRAHVSFDRAMRMLLARGGIPMNAFLRINGLDELIESLIGQLEGMKQADRSRWDVSGLVERERAAVERLLDQGGKDPKTAEALRRLREALKRALSGDASSGLNVNRVLELGWRSGSDAFEELFHRLRQLLPLNELQRRERFTGSSPLSPRDAERIGERFLAIDRLEEELREALESGDLLRLDASAVREVLGDAAADALEEKRDELLSRFNGELEQSGLVEVEDGIYKLTPAAARKLGTAFLREMFSILKSDGLGKHAASITGEGQVESVRTRPYEFGDSLAHVDLPSSMVNALVREGAGLPIRLRASDFEVHETIGTARAAICVLIDMSGSMARYGRFYNTKKVALALDALMRAEFPEDRLYFVGFATFARQYRVADIASLAPKPVTHSAPVVKMSLDFDAATDPKRKAAVPQYFTNTQKALELGRRLLMREESANRHIILITDGVPTAYYLGPRLTLTYPPTPQTFHETLREVRACTDAGIVINTFMMTSDWEFDYHGEREFVERMAKINGGRLFYPSPDSLTQYVLVDYMRERKRLFEV